MSSFDSSESFLCVCATQVPFTDPHLPPAMPSFTQKVLLALSAAIIVACSEGILYLIWEDRRARRTRSRRPLRFIRSTRETDKKQDLDVLHASSQDSSRSQNLDPAVVSVTSAHVPGTSDGVLRERTVASADEPARQNQ